MYIIENDVLVEVSKRDIVLAEIPKHVRRIENYAFYNLEALEVVIMDGVRYIGYKAFEFCKRLKKVCMSNSVTDIQEGAFNHCRDLIIEVNSYRVKSMLITSGFEGGIVYKKINKK